MTMLSVTEAAEIAGVSRTTIYDRLKSGDLSKTPDGIDPAELLRVFGELKAGSVDRSSGDPLPASPEMIRWLRELVDQQRATIERKDALLQEAEEKAAEERQRADERLQNVLSQLDRTTALLPAPDPSPEPPRGFWSKLFG